MPEVDLRTGDLFRTKNRGELRWFESLLYPGLEAGGKRWGVAGGGIA